MGRQQFTVLATWLVGAATLIAWALTLGLSITCRLWDGPCDEVESTVNKLREAVYFYETFVGRLPTTEEGLDALLSGQGTRFGPILSQLVADPWGRIYRYERTTPTTFVIASAGPDGRFDTIDDLRRDHRRLCRVFVEAPAVKLDEAQVLLIIALGLSWLFVRVHRMGRELTS